MAKQVKLGDRVYINTPHHLYERKVGTVYASTGKGGNTRYMVEWETTLETSGSPVPSYSAHEISTAR